MSLRLSSRWSHSLRIATSNNAAHREVDERNKFRCDSKHECYCCINERPEPYCYDTWDECKAACPTCNPKCPP
uniref:Uncharacterized protein n=1 Tax=Setaria viridis TaxID=4556 RepID=A0A4U6T7Q8_SETVI|nr:hypothetical protein SEVIR_9G522200v2 [Setaria viridis]